jgi:hypothetical protein
MNQALNEIDRRAFRHDMVDGLTEVAMGLFFLVPAISLGNPAFSWMIILPILFLGPGLKKIRARHTYPRIGFVEPRGEKPAELFRGMALYTLGAVVAIAVGVFLWRGQITPGLVRQVAPLLASLLFGGGLLYAAGRSGLRRYYLLIAISVGLGTSLVFVTLPGRYHSVQIYLIVMAVILFLFGMATFVHFLKTHPVRVAEEAEDVG